MKKKIQWLCLLLLIGSGQAFTQTSKTETAYWGHRFYPIRNVAYGTDPQQVLDIYRQGHFVGEPDFFRPFTETKPTVIFFHGGGWVGGVKDTKFSYLIYFLQKGYNVVNVEYRVGKNTAPDAADDAMAAVKWVAENHEQYKIDCNNIVIAGESAGGHLALMSGLMNTVHGSHPDYIGDKIKIKAIVDWFGITDIEKVVTFLDTRPWNYALEWIGDKSRVKEISKKFSPMYFVTKNAPPIFMVQGSDDTLVPIEQSEALHKALDALGVSNEFIRIEGGQHAGFSDEDYQLIYPKLDVFLSSKIDQFAK